MSLRSALRRWFFEDPTAAPVEVEEARSAAQPPMTTPERAGFPYGIPRGGLSEVYQGLGAATQSDRRTLMQQLFEAYLACPWSWAAINAIARTVTAGGLVSDWDGDDGEGDQEVPPKPAPVVAMERLFAFVNPREDIRQLMRSVITDLLVFGDAFIEVVWVGNVPVSLYSLDSPSMFPVADEHGTISGYVQVTDFGQRAEFEPRDVIHISLDAPRSGVYGISPTQANLLPITAWLFTAATAKEIFRKGNPPNLHVDFPNGTSSTELNRWDAMYAARNIGPRNIGTPIITKGGAKVEELKQGSVVEYIDFLNQKRDEILAGYGVPPAQAGVIESGNLGGGTGESQRMTFMVNTCQPIAQLVLEKINFHIAKQGFGVVGWHVKFAEVDMRDSKTVEEIRDMRLRNGSYTLNRYRAEINEPPVDGGDDAVLVDRQNLVLWRDIPAMSQAMVAKNAKGSSLEVDEPQDGQPVKLMKPEPQPIPPALAANAGLPGHDPAQPPPPPGGKGKKGNPAPEDQPQPGESVVDRDWRRLSEAWTREYQSRRAQALAELPLAEHAWADGDSHTDHDHHNSPDYRPADLGVKALHLVTVNPADVQVDHTYQRPLEPTHVNRLVKLGADDLKQRVGLLAKRPDGSLWVVDGQHHTAAAVKLGITTLRYQQFASSGPEMEKRVYQAWQHWDQSENPKVRGEPQLAGSGR